MADFLYEIGTRVKLVVKGEMTFGNIDAYSYEDEHCPYIVRYLVNRTPRYIVCTPYDFTVVEPEVTQPVFKPEPLFSVGDIVNFNHYDIGIVQQVDAEDDDYFIESLHNGYTDWISGDFVRQPISDGTDFETCVNEYQLLVGTSNSLEKKIAELRTELHASTKKLSELHDVVSQAEGKLLTVARGKEVN